MSDMEKKASARLKRMAQMLLSVVTGVCVAVSLGVCLCRYTVFEPSLYPDMMTENYAAQVAVYIMEDMKPICEQTGIPYEAVSSGVNQGAVQVALKAYVEHFYTAVTKDVALEPVSYPAAYFDKSIRQYYASHEQALPEDTQIASQAEQMAAVADKRICVLNGDSVTAHLADDFYHNPVLHKLVDYHFIGYVVSAILIALCLLFSSKHVMQRLYRTAGAIFLGCAVWAVPVALANLYNLPRRVLDLEYPVSLLISTILRTFSRRAMSISGIASIVAGACLLAVIVYIVVKKYAYGKKHHSVSEPKTFLLDVPGDYQIKEERWADNQQSVSPFL